MRIQQKCVNHFLGPSTVLGPENIAVSQTLEEMKQKADRQELQQADVMGGYFGLGSWLCGKAQAAGTGQCRP